MTMPPPLSGLSRQIDAPVRRSLIAYDHA